MNIKWRKYLSPCLLKHEKQLRSLKLYRFINFLKLETFEVYHNGYKLSVRYFYEDKDEIHFNLYYQIKNPVFSCTLKRLDSNGGYFQIHINRNTKDILPKTSLGAIFQKIIREHRNDFTFINEIYSTSPDNNISNSLSPTGHRFWEKQVENNLAIWIEDENRFKAILE